MGARVGFLAGVLVGFVLCALMFALVAPTSHNPYVRSLNISPLTGNKIRFVVSDVDGNTDTYIMENKDNSLLIETKRISVNTGSMSLTYGTPTAAQPGKPRLASFWEAFVGKGSLTLHH